VRIKINWKLMQGTDLFGPGKEGKESVIEKK
jgi:hypothetical protein